MSARVFVIADLHFGHKKLAEVRGFASVQEHDDAIVAAWNRTVKASDVVYVLGDVFRLDRVAELKGTKKLAMGNHDQYPIARYVPLFSQIRAYYEFDGYILSHIPVHPSQFSRYLGNIHGHTHNHTMQEWHPAMNGNDGDWVDDRRYFPVSVEWCISMEPFLLRDLISILRARR